MTVRKKTGNTKLITARIAAGLTQDAVAKKLKMNRAHIVRIEQGWIPPKAIRERLAGLLKASAAELFNDALSL